jgi:hypothetical protein
MTAGRPRGIRRWRSSLGQTTTEWLMIAGILTAIAIFFNGTLPSAARYYSRGIILSVRTVAP